MKKKYLTLFLLCVQVLGYVPVVVAEEASQSVVSESPVKSDEERNTLETSETSPTAPMTEEAGQSAVSQVPATSEKGVEIPTTSSSSSSNAVSVAPSSSSRGEQTVAGLSLSADSSSIGQTTQLETFETTPGVSVAPVAKEVEVVKERAVRKTTTSTAIVPLYRLYHPGLRVHLYTKDTNEYAVLGTRGWNQEGLAWNTAGNQGETVYRLYHPGLRVHLYTKDTNEYTVLAGRGWQQEGSAFRSSGETPIYRLYHSGLRKHLYTKDTNEYRVLANRGWRQEGIAFYGLGAPTPTPPVPSQSKPSTGAPSSSTKPSSSTRPSSTTKPSSSTKPSTTSSSSSKHRDRIYLSYVHTYEDGSSYYNSQKESGHLTLYGPQDKVPSFKREGYRIKEASLTLFGSRYGGGTVPVEFWYLKDLPADAHLTYDFLSKLDRREEYPYHTYFSLSVTWEKAPVTSQETVTKTQKRVTLAHKTVRQADANLWEGEENVTRQGVDGYQLIEVTTTKDNQTGKVTTSEQVLETKPATDKIVSYGTKKRYTTTSVSIEEVVNFTTKTVYDANLEQGKTEIRQVGINGKKVIRVTTTVDNKTGEKTERREVVSQDLAQEEIVAIGTKKPVVTTPTKKTVTAAEFIAMSEEEQDAFIANGGSIPRNGRQYLTQAELDETETIINVTKLNQELARLMNEERAKLGRSAVTYAGKDSTLQDTVDTRANEMALHGSLRYQDKVEGAHKRPDGSDWRTAASAEHAAKVIWQGENSLQLGRAIDRFSASNEVKLAQTLFRNWMDSSGHRRLMMRDGDYHMAVSVAMGSRTYGSSQDDAGVTIAILQMAKLRP